VTAALALAIVAALPYVTPPATTAVLERYTLVIGANNGGPGRPALQYAISDADSFARVMTELGGVLPENQVLLKQPRVRDLVSALDALNAKVVQARRTNAGGRIEILLYYSGHADELGLLLGEDRYSYRTLRDRLDEIPADVRIAVLDACASGAFTRLKGGTARPPFVVDDAASMRGHAFLTSSSETEAAQESDRIRGSYFTHFLVSGFRGAADHSGDGKVTLSEAYQFAFSETLGRTVDTRGGAQHPSYDINLSGSGDVVMTDMRQTSATLVLGEDLDGRFFIRNAAQELVVELYKPKGRKVELGLEPGTYDVRIEREKQSLVAKTRIADRERVTLDAAQFGVAVLEPTQRRGDTPVSPMAVAGRYRFEIKLGIWQKDRQTLFAAGTGWSNLLGGLQYTHYFTEHTSMFVGIETIGSEAGSGTSFNLQNSFSGTAEVLAIPIGVRWNPIRTSKPPEAVKPYVSVAVVPAIGEVVGGFVNGNTEISGIYTEGTVGGQVGGGVDFHVSRKISIGLGAGYTWMAKFDQPIGSLRDFSGPEVSVSFGLLFGKSTARH
jgi:hypothetical protein